MQRLFAAPLLAVILLTGCGAPAPAEPPPPTSGGTPVAPAPQPEKVVKSDEEWRKALTPEQYRILREKGTERAFTGIYWETKTPGTYRCAGCGEVLFQSDTKFDSGCGWPSFFRAANNKAITETADDTLGMHRVEVTCTKCGGHLGHVFDDGPEPTGLRYCINSASIKLEERR